MEEVEQTFRMLLGKTNGLGLSNATVLVQEFLTGVNPKYVYKTNVSLHILKTNRK